MFRTRDVWYRELHSLHLAHAAEDKAKPVIWLGGYSAELTRIFMTLGVRGTPKVLKIFSGVPSKILKVGIFPGAVKRLRPVAALRLHGSRQNLFAASGKTHLRHQAKPPLFSKF